jgi:CRP/FNR family transcriptional regulator, nitrogen oxide reductase regulator
MSGPPRAALLDFLRTCAIFEKLPAGELESLAATAREDPCPAREYVFHEGDPALFLCFVKTGHIRIVRHTPAGKTVVLELLGPGEVFGGVAVFERRPYPASAQAAEPTVVVKLPADAVIGVAQRHPSVVAELVRLIGRRLRAAHDSVTSLSVDPVEARLATRLLRLADREGVPGPRGVELPFHLTRQSLADMSGTTVETTIRVVSRWIKDELVEDRAGRLVIKKPEALRDLAGGDAAP